MPRTLTIIKSVRNTDGSRTTLLLDTDRALRVLGAKAIKAKSRRARALYGALEVRYTPGNGTPLPKTWHEVLTTNP